MASMQLRHSFSPPDNARLAHLCGPLDEHLRTIEDAFGVTLHRRGEQFRIEGARGVPQQVVALLDSLYARADRPLSAELVQLAVASSLRQSTHVARRPRAGAPAGAGADADRDPGAVQDGEGPDGPEGPQLHTRRADLQGRTPNQVAYLRHILQFYRRSEPSDEDVQHLKRRLEQTGGSPLYEVTERIAAGVQQALDGRSPGEFVVRTAMKHSPPYVDQVVKEMTGAWPVPSFWS
ncbi:MAG: ferrochelatase [Proteobacteria bacterium]|nr:ferrochelatase [Pseudomonadota bacterium]